MVPIKVNHNARQHRSKSTTTQVSNVFLSNKTTNTDMLFFLKSKSTTGKVPLRKSSMNSKASDLSVSNTNADDVLKHKKEPVRKKAWEVRGSQTDIGVRERDEGKHSKPEALLWPTCSEITCRKQV